MEPDMRSSPALSSTVLASSQPDSQIDVSHSLSYWNSVSSDTNGMLGGFPQTTRIDLQGSANFLTKLRRGGAKGEALEPMRRVADCGAGIGRVTKGLLVKVSQRVDVVEPVKKFTDVLVDGMEEGEKGKLGDVVNLGLQDWVPEAGAYDLIWNQWCVGHLTDVQLVEYLRRCKDGLSVGDGRPAWIVVKENISPSPRDIYDDEDSSVTRSEDKFKSIFKEAGLRIMANEIQRGMPKELYPVRIFALKPE